MIRWWWWWWWCNIIIIIKSYLLLLLLLLLLLRPFPLLVVTNTSCFGLKITNLPQENPHSSCTKRVCFGSAPVLLVGCPESSNESIEASPGLPERAGAGRRRIRQPKERTILVMHLGLAKLVQVPEEFKNVSSTAHGETQRWPVVPKVLAECVPVSPLLALIPARRRCGRRWWRCSCCWGCGNRRAWWWEATSIWWWRD